MTRKYTRGRGRRLSVPFGHKSQHQYYICDYAKWQSRIPEREKLIPSLKTELLKLVFKMDNITVLTMVSTIVLDWDFLSVTTIIVTPLGGQVNRCLQVPTRQLSYYSSMSDSMDLENFLSTDGDWFFSRRAMFLQEWNVILFPRLNYKHAYVCWHWNCLHSALNKQYYWSKGGSQ